ncbi:MAG: hypothetical protein RBS02_13600 [Steroidobacteraceae bacterium]|nr:hypothetical protein [Steroidobacteraceae bacterium]
MFELLFTHPAWAYRSGAFAFASAWPRWTLAGAVVFGVALVALTLSRRRELGWRKLLALGALQATFVALALALLWRPVLNVERVRDRENILAIALDASASMGYGEDGRSRTAQAVAALQSGPLGRMAETFEVRLFGFSQAAHAVDSLDALAPEGSQTRIGEVLTQVLQSAGSAPLAGVVLVSDGAENGGTLDEERLAQIASFGVPVHTVGVGPETSAGDLELERADVPGSAPPGARVPAQISVRHDGAAATRVRVYDRETLIAARELQLPAEASLTTVTLDLPPLSAGAHQLRFSLDPLEGERNTINNTRLRVLDAPAARRHILYLEGEPRWEYKFLRRAAERERALRIASVVRTTPNKHYRQGVMSPAELIDGFPAAAEELYAYDAVIIGSYEAATLRPAQHELLRDFVDKRGGSLLMLAGRQGLAAGGWGRSALAQTLPVQLPEDENARFVQRVAHAQPTVYGLESAIAKLDDDPRRNAERWANLPQLADWQTLGRLKPGAVVLLEAASGPKREPLLVWQHYGRGAAFVLGSASTLRWQMRMPPEDLSHETFWRQLLYAMTSLAPQRATLASERIVYDDERSVVLQAQLRDERFEPIDDAHVELHVAPERDPAFLQTMQSSGRGDGRYTAVIDAASTGLYRIDMRARRGAEDVGAAIAHVLRNDGVAEHFGVRQHRDVLERIAAVSGGRYWSLDELDSLAAAIPYSRAGVVERQTLDLWNLPIVFLMLLALKLAEWLLRLRWGRL